jgi:Glycerol-3-phosphate dehydrogenase
VKKIAIVGTGAWGTALAIHGARAGLAVSLLGYRDDIVDDWLGRAPTPRCPAPSRSRPSSSRR